MLTKESVVTKIEISTDTGHVFVTRRTRVVEDGVVLGEFGNHRTAYEPGEDVTHEDERVKAHTAAAWTPEVVSAHEARLAAREQTPKGE